MIAAIRDFFRRTSAAGLFIIGYHLTQKGACKGALD